MPIYDYTCARCGHLAEVIHGMRDAGPRFCPSCGAEGTMRKGFAAPAVHFKGSGWAKKDRSATATPGGASSPGRSKTAKSGDDSTSGAGTDAGSGGASSTGEASGGASSTGEASTPAGSGQAAATSAAADGGD